MAISLFEEDYKQVVEAVKKTSATPAPVKNDSGESIVLRLVIGGEPKLITLATYNIDGTELYRAQDLLYGYGMEKIAAKITLQNWVISMQTKSIDFQYSKIQGKGKVQGTYLTKRQIMKLAGYIDYDFEDQVYEAFELLTKGEYTQASIVSGHVALDLVFAAHVQSRWKDYCAYVHKNFGSITKNYGGNLTRLVVRVVSGYPTVAAIKGECGTDLITKLIEQENFAAIQAINATLDIVHRYFTIDSTLEMFSTKDGKKKVYWNIKQLLGDDC